MQIHELPDYTGDLETGFVVVDDGSQTGKATGTELFGPINTRIDNIITNPAPTEQEIIDARADDGGYVYTTLAQAIQGQVNGLKYVAKATPYTLTAVADGYVNTGDGTVKTSVSGYKNCGKVKINDGISKLVIKNTFHYGVDGIALYDVNNNFIKGIDRTIFIDRYAVIDLPANAYYFNICWKTTDGIGYVADWNGEVYDIVADATHAYSAVVNPFICKSKNVFQPWFASSLRRLSDGTATFSIVASGNGGVYGRSINVTGGKLLYVRTNYTGTNSASRLRAYLYGTSKAGAANTTVNLQVDIPQGDYEFAIDMDYQDVYGNLDISKPLAVLIVNKTNYVDTITVNKFEYGYYTTELDNVIKPDLLTSLNSIRDQLTKANVKYTGRENIIVSPNGDKHALQANNAGSLQLVPVTPSKAMFFGNSILLGFNNDYGISSGNYYGMAASSNTRDYYAKFNNYVTSLNSEYVPERLRYNTWENATSLSAQKTIADDMATHVDSSTDLVVVQLGDNVNTDAKKAIFEEGAKYLLKKIRTSAPNARVVWLGSWFNSSLINQVMPSICSETGCVFVPISDLNTPDNQSYVGAIYSDTDGSEYTIDSAGVAAHPGNSGMLAIANRLAYGIALTGDESTIA